MTPEKLELREKLAELAHEQWSGWMDYLFSKCIDYNSETIQAEEGAVIMPKWAVDRWKKQAKTPYSELTPNEMDSDRTEVDKFLAVFNTRHTSENERKLAADTIRNLIDALEMIADNGDYVVRLKARQSAIESGHIVLRRLEE